MRRLLIALIATSLIALTLASVQTAVPVRGQTGINPGQWYNVVAKHSGQCLDIANGSTAPGATLMQYPCHSGDNQAFRFNPVGGGYYTITAGNSALCIDQANATFNNGDRFMQYFCHGGTNQQFQVISGQVGAGFYNQIRVRHSGKNMDVANFSFSPGATIVQFNPHGGDNQQFELRPAPTPCAGRDADADGMVSCFDCDDNDPNVQECEQPDPCVICPECCAR